jgi:hypothetical protein
MPFQGILMRGPHSKRGRKLQQQRSEDSISRRTICGCEGRIYFCDRNCIERNGFMFFQQVSLSVTWHNLFSTLFSLLFINLRLFVINIVYLNFKQCSGRACMPTTVGLDTICYGFLTVWYTRLCKKLYMCEDELTLLQGFKNFSEV